MPFSWYDYLTLAENLKDHAPAHLTEAGYRSAVSRAYYAAYGHARNFAVNCGLVIDRKAKDHKVVAEFYLENDGETLDGKEIIDGAEIQQTLDSLRKLRNSCDYNGSFTVPEIEVKDAIASAKLIFDRLK